MRKKFNTAKKLSDNPAGQCTECKRIMPAIRRTNKCTNCTPSRYQGHHESLVCTLYHRCIIDLNKCQICNEHSCEFLWSSWSDAQYVVRMYSRDPLENVAEFWSDLLDLTAVCLPCRSKCHGNKNVWWYGTVGKALFDCENGAYWRHVAQSMKEFAEKLPPLDDQATDARPGSRDKVAVLARRVEQGRHLYHPDDERRPLAPKEKPRVRLEYVPNWQRQAVLDLAAAGSMEGNTDDGSTWLNSVSSR